jgi:Tfp pilus assembly major pilin PilA
MFGQLLELANLDLVVIAVILILQTVKGMLYVQHVLLRDALTHIGTRIERTTRQVMSIVTSRELIL